MRTRLTEGVYASRYIRDTRIQIIELNIDVNVGDGIFEDDIMRRMIVVSGMKKKLLNREGVRLDNTIMRRMILITDI